MRFRIARPATTVSVALRRAGYAPWTEAGETQSFIRRLATAPYPRFHVYVNNPLSEQIELNLHLDQKRPSYAGTHAHGGEYGGPVVEAEASRIQQLLT